MVEFTSNAKQDSLNINNECLALNVEWWKILSLNLLLAAKQLTQCLPSDGNKYLLEWMDDGKASGLVFP